MRDWWRWSVTRELSRLRSDGRAALLWSLRITVAAVASYVVGTLFFPGTQPLLAPLTAMLVVQVTPVSLLASGIDRVVAVVTGVSLAVAFATVVPLQWWSLGLLIFISITIGQVLRLRSNLIEVAMEMKTEQQGLFGFNHVLEPVPDGFHFSLIAGLQFGDKIERFCLLHGNHLEIDADVPLGMDDGLASRFLALPGVIG